jgi:hypothetical protein
LPVAPQDHRPRAFSDAVPVVSGHAAKIAGWSRLVVV